MGGQLQLLGFRGWVTWVTIVYTRPRWDGSLTSERSMSCKVAGVLCVATACATAFAAKNGWCVCAYLS